MLTRSTPSILTENGTVRPRSSAEFSGAQIAVLFAALALVASIPVITHPLPPLSDYVNHLARMHVMASIGHDPDLTRFYEIDWQIIPNLMMDLVVPRLTAFMTVYHAGQLFTVATFVLIASGTLALNRALFGSWSVLPLISFPLLYNHVFLVGVMNYVFGIGLALWGMAVWIMLRERFWAIRLAVSALFVLVLFFCHLFDVGVYGLGLLSIELTRLWMTRGRPLAPRLVDFVATGIPFLPVLPLLFMSPTWDLAGEYYWEKLGKIDGLVYVVEVYSDIVAFLLIAGVAAGAIWAARHRLLRLHPLGWAFLGVGAAVYIAMPHMLFDTFMADQRLPIALAFMVIACVDLQMRHRIVRRGFLALLLLMLVVRVIEVDVAWADLSGNTMEFRDSVKRIKRGASVLVAYGDKGAGDDVSDLGLVHAACLAMIERSALVTTAFTVRGKQVMHVRPEYTDRVDTEDGNPPSIEQLVVAREHPEEVADKYWRRWQESFDYVYVLFTDEDTVNPAPDLLKLVYEGDRFQLYRISKAADAKNAKERFSGREKR
ncbi:MAG: hypothetical protein JO328_05770 [Hyphomicrobiales bacterium]|nr:hypothetical protein [Hyphomicrobiales bacterium]MBV8826859.1 hypothetical protein [Hyphomicrobiales bacterium]